MILYHKMVMCRKYEEEWSLMDTSPCRDLSALIPLVELLPGPGHGVFAMPQWSLALQVQGVLLMWCTGGPVRVWILCYCHSCAMAV